MANRTIKEEDFGRSAEKAGYVICQNVGGKCNICGRDFFPGDLTCKGGHEKGVGYFK
ncbi:MAG: hypothetical protein K9M44_00485 [Candidatus Pacebacteria bacterium]|nr:hypothetical protein [Candidatus Paceibacterota bacterium]